MRRGHGNRGAALAVAALVALGAAAPAAHGAVVDPPAAHAAAKKKKSKAKATRVVLPAPSQGDISYAVIQVKTGKTAKVKKAKRGRQVFKAKKVGGVRIGADSSAWRKLKKSTKVHVAVNPVSTVNGPQKGLRTVTIFAQRRMGAKNPKAKGNIAFTMANATPVKESFYYRASKGSVTSVFTVRNAIGTAVDNWARYVAVLQAANAMKAALNPVDKNGTFRASAAAVTASKVSFGGHKRSALTQQAAAKLFLAMNDRLVMQDLKKDPLMARYIKDELRNTALAARWAEVVAKVPALVPDQYAAAAAEEAKFHNVKPVKISRTKVTIADDHNLLDAVSKDIRARFPLVNVEVTRIGTGAGRVVEVAADPATGGIESEGDNPAGKIDCGTTCIKAYRGGWNVTLQAVPAPGSQFDGFTGCEEYVKWTLNSPDGCNLEIKSLEGGNSHPVSAKFTKIPTTGGGNGGGTGTGGNGGQLGGGYVTIGSDLRADANHADRHRQDSVYWNDRLPGDNRWVVPLDSQVVEVLVKGGATTTHNYPNNPRNDVAIQVLRSSGDTFRVPEAGGTSTHQKGDPAALFRIPFSNEPNREFTSFRPENLCAQGGDRVALNTKGGWQAGWNTAADSDYWLGIPFQVFATGIDGAEGMEFHKHDGTGNGAHLQDGVSEDGPESGQDYTSVELPIVKPGQELLMQVKLAFGDLRSYPCGGRNPNG